MKNVKLSGRYANAFYQFAIEQNVEEAVYQDIILLKEVFSENRDLRVIIESPIIAASKKEAIITALFQEKVSPITLGFLKLIILKRREPSLPAIFNKFVEYYYEKHQIRSAIVTSAIELPAELVEKLTKILEEQTRSTIMLQQIVDPAIIGGLVIRMDDYLFDASVQGRIKRLKTEFSHNLYQVSF